MIGTLYLTGVLLASPTMHLSSPHSSLRTVSRMLGGKLEIVQKTHWYLVIVIGNMYAEYSLDKYTVYYTVLSGVMFSRVMCNIPW